MAGLKKKKKREKEWKESLQRRKLGGREPKGGEEEEEEEEEERERERERERETDSLIESHRASIPSNSCKCQKIF